MAAAAQAAAMNLLTVRRSNNCSSNIRKVMLYVPRASASSTDGSTGKKKRVKKSSNSKNKKDAGAVAVTADDGKNEQKEVTTVSSIDNSSELEKKGVGESGVIKRLDEVVNPVGLGRKSRQIFDEVWKKFSGLGQISRTDYDSGTSNLVYGDGAPLCEFTVPGAQNTTVLVVGATSRIGRLVVRKLMLRGYTVKGFVRRIDQEVMDMLPRSVELVVGDVGDPVSIMDAVEGCSKIIYCATARSAITGDLNRVDNRGVYNVSKAFQDYNNKLAQLRAGKSSKSKLLISKFKSEDSLNGWEIRQGTYFQDVIATKYDGGMDAKFVFNENGLAIFSGYVFTRGGYVELSRKISLPLGFTLDRYEGLVLSVGGNGRSYVVILEAGPLADPSQSKMYFSRINTKAGFCRVRVPFSSFRPVSPTDPPLDPFLVHTLTIRFEPRKQRPVEGPNGMKQDPRSFELILEYIKALPSGQETDFILVSCTGSGIEASRRDQVLKAKKHSSMMVLYHLHNPTAPAFVTTCNICHLDIETGQGWRCETCPEYDVCNACFQKDGAVDHPHKLTNYPSIAERDAQNKEARQLRVVQLRKMLDLLVHASLCKSPPCHYPNCRKVKGLFRHGIHCKTRASGGCVLCKKMWYLLQLHARACKESECNVPRCRDLKEHLRRLQQQSDSRRRAAVTEMMRQRAKEVAGTS